MAFARTLRFFPRPLPALRVASIRNKSAQAAYELPSTAPDDLCDEHIFTEEHFRMRNTLNKIIEKDINPFVDEWENEKDFPAHKIFKKLGDAGLLGVTKPVEFGGLGLDYSYSVAVAEELGMMLDFVAFAPLGPPPKWSDTGTPASSILSPWYQPWLQDTLQFQR